jgi:formylglycine-generating enzyme
MRKIMFLMIIVITVVLSACSQEKQNNFVFIKGGTIINTTSSFYGKNEVVADFYISKYEVTQKEWKDIMGSNPSAFKGDDLPVETVSWYNCIEYCNKRSAKEDLEPYYNINKDKKDPDNKSDYDDMKWTVTTNPKANGYRLPTEAEWEYAAGGGQKSEDYSYSGSNKADEVAWYWKNAGNKYLTGDWNWSVIENNKNSTKPIGTRNPNELGLYDMSGNVREWCWDWYEDAENRSGLYRVWKGGGWIGDVSCCESSYRGKYEANGWGSDQGFRICKDI